MDIMEPTDAVRVVVDKTAQFVACHGEVYGSRIAESEAGNPLFSFLNPDDPCHAFYRWKVDTLKALIDGRDPPPKPQQASRAAPQVQRAVTPPSKQADVSCPPSPAPPLTLEEFIGTGALHRHCEDFCVECIDGARVVALEPDDLEIINCRPIAQDAQEAYWLRRALWEAHPDLVRRHGDQLETRFRTLPALAVVPWAEFKQILRAMGVDAVLVKALQRRLEAGGVSCFSTPRSSRAPTPAPAAATEAAAARAAAAGSAVSAEAAAALAAAAEVERLRLEGKERKDLDGTRPPLVSAAAEALIKTAAAVAGLLPPAAAAAHNEPALVYVTPTTFSSTDSSEMQPPNSLEPPAAAPQPEPAEQKEATVSAAAPAAPTILLPRGVKKRLGGPPEAPPRHQPASPAAPVQSTADQPGIEKAFEANLAMTARVVAADAANAVADEARKIAADAESKEAEARATLALAEKAVSSSNDPLVLAAAQRLAAEAAIFASREREKPVSKAQALSVQQQRVVPPPETQQPAPLLAAAAPHPVAVPPAEVVLDLSPEERAQLMRRPAVPEMQQRRDAEQPAVVTAPLIPSVSLVGQATGGAPDGQSAVMAAISNAARSGDAGQPPGMTAPAAAEAEQQALIEHQRLQQLQKLHAQQQFEQLMQEQQRAQQQAQQQAQEQAMQQHMQQQAQLQAQQQQMQTLQLLMQQQQASGLSTTPEMAQIQVLLSSALANMTAQLNAPPIAPVPAVPLPQGPVDPSPAVQGAPTEPPAAIAGSAGIAGATAFVGAAAFAVAAPLVAAEELQPPSGGGSEEKRAPSRDPEQSQREMAELREASQRLHDWQQQAAGGEGGRGPDQAAPSFPEADFRDMARRREAGETGISRASQHPGVLLADRANQPAPLFAAISAIRAATDRLAEMPMLLEGDEDRGAAAQTDRDAQWAYNNAELRRRQLAQDDEQLPVGTLSIGDIASAVLQQMAEDGKHLQELTCGPDERTPFSSMVVPPTPIPEDPHKPGGRVGRLRIDEDVEADNESGTDAVGGLVVAEKPQGECIQQ